MSTALLGFRVWIATIFINAVFFLLSGLFVDGIPDVLLGMLFFLIGIFVGVPFLILTIALIHVTRLIPYRTAGRMVWLFGVESGLVIAFYAFLSFLFDQGFSLNKDMRLLTGTTIAAFLVSLWLNRKGFDGKSVDGPAGTDARDTTPSPINSVS